MSQDIRSFFIRTPKENKSNEKKESVQGTDSKKRNRKRIVLDSDSDEEPLSKVSKVDKNTPKDKKKKSPQKKKVSPTKSKYFELPQASVADMLGKKPVKRVEQPKLKLAYDQRKIYEEFGNDDDFQNAFQLLDEIEKEDGLLKKEDRTNEKTTNELIAVAAKQKEREKHKLFPSLEGASKEELEQTEKHSSQKKQKFHSDSPDKLISFKKVKRKELSAKDDFEEKLHLEEGKNSSKHQLSPEILENNSPPSKNGQEKLQNAENIVQKKKEANNKTLKNNINLKEGIQKSHSQHKEHSLSTVSLSRSLRGVSLSENSVKQEKFNLWVEKYKPSNLKQIIGQQGEKSNVNKLLRWLRDWYNNHNGKKKLTKPSPWAKDDNGAYFKAALLSGSPGIGKTTTVHLVCKEMNLDMVELNASDTRSKKLLADEVSELISTKSLSQYVTGGAGMSRQHVLVMDEVDGMAGTEDRGGIQELIQLIKNSKIPIICMCNDRNHPKIRSLVNYCFDLRFNKPRVDQIKGAMMSICFKEKLKINPETMNEIITSTNQDIRLILNHLSMLAARNSVDMEMARKYIKLGPWDVLRKVFSEEEHKKMTVYDKSDLFFHDYSVAPLFVHENYLLVIPHSQEVKTKQGKMELFSKAISSLCVGDLMESAIRSNSSWSLLPVQAMFSSVIPGEALEGHLGGQISFPAWFGKNSRRSKLDRLAQELQQHTRLKTSCSKEAMKLDYCKVLRDEVIRPLAQNRTGGIPDALAFLHGYDLLREDLEALTELNTWPQTHDPFTSIDSKVKAAFTRAYNKAPVMTPFSIVAPIKRNKGGGTDQEYAEEEPEEEEVDDLNIDGMIVVKKKVEKKVKEKKEDKTTDKKISEKPKKVGRGRKPKGK